MVIAHSKQTNNTILLQNDPPSKQIVDQLTNLTVPESFNVSFAFQNSTNGDLFFIFEPDRGM
jgi:hypothetical protein